MTRSPMTPRDYFRTAFRVARSTKIEDPVGWAARRTQARRNAPKGGLGRPC